MAPAVVLILPKTGYRNEDFLAAAKKLGAEVIQASDVCHRLAEQWEEHPLALRFREAEAAASELAAQVAQRNPVAVIGVDDQSSLVAALAAEKLGIAQNPVRAVAAARSKEQSRARLHAAGLPVPRFEVVARDLPPAEIDALAARSPYPCVVKPLVLSGSRGVIRADDPAQLRAALSRVAALLRSPEVAQRRDPDLARLLVEEFIPGPEIALEGLLVRGQLHVLAIFDKPDALDGPFFEETLYITPSRHPAQLQDGAARAVAEGCAGGGGSRDAERSARGGERGGVIEPHAHVLRFTPPRRAQHRARGGSIACAPTLPRAREAPPAFSCCPSASAALSRKFAGSMKRSACRSSRTS